MAKPKKCGVLSATGWECDEPVGHKDSENGYHSSAGDGFHAGRDYTCLECKAKAYRHSLWDKCPKCKVESKGWKNVT